MPGEPNAPAVMLFKKGELLLAGYGLRTSSMASSLRVQVRLKILTEEGKSNGEVSILHSGEERLHGFKGRTVLPDGRVIPVPDDARFVRKTSRSHKTFTTAVAFPAVQVGAILDYEYELWFDSIFFLEPWYFSDDVPVRHSEITFKTPLNLGVKGWSRGPSTVLLQRQTDRTPNGYVTKVWGDNVPSVPDDPYGPPYQDLAVQMLMLPTSIGSEKLMESWPETCKLVSLIYDEAGGRDGGVARTAREIAGSGSPADKVRTLHRFVRDQVKNEGYIGALVDPDHGIGKVLSTRKGSRAEKALLLQAMLDAVDVPSRLVWAASRDRGAIDLQCPNPAWFDTVLVRVELDGKLVFLDTSDPTLGFGRLGPGYEGTPALLYDKKKPEAITLPATPYDRNLQRAEIDLSLDDKGRLAGAGTLRLTGHQAWEKLGLKDDEAKTSASWKEWLEKRYRDFQVSGVKAVESIEDETVTVTWSLAQREEETLGDESSLTASEPLRQKQPFVQPVAERRSAVQFDYPYRDEVELKLRWPAGWKLSVHPSDLIKVTPAGKLALETEVHEEDHSLVYRRQLDLTRREFTTSKDYESLRAFFGEVEKQDAQKLVLVKK